MLSIGSYWKKNFKNCEGDEEESPSAASAVGNNEEYRNLSLKVARFRIFLHVDWSIWLCKILWNYKHELPENSDPIKEHAVKIHKPSSEKVSGTPSFATEIR